MASAAESAPRNHLVDGPEDLMGARTVPIITPTIQMSAPSPGEPMEITTPTSSSAPASATKSPDSDVNVNGYSERSNSVMQNDQLPMDNIIMPAPVAAAAAVHQPKIVQTAFIHKLYNMLEDKTIQHLITWTPSSESFIVQPNHEFSKVLAQYFKHTNTSSFVRQLNMYGFHKVSDTFHHGVPDTTLWEFKHGNGNFKRGDLVGLREIKRRASRHAIVHREYNGGQKPPPSQPGTPAEPMPPMQEGGDPRLNNMEHTLFDLSIRLQRNEEYTQFMRVKHQTLMDTVSRLLQFNQDLSRAVLALAPSPDHPIHREVSNLQGEVQRQMETVRSLEEPHEPLFASSRQYFSNLENAPVSPRQLPQDDPRRSNLAVPQSRQPNYYRPSVPSGLSISTRRPYGSIGANTTQSSPSSLRAQPPPPPPGPHPLANVELPNNLARRHTSADIREHGWQPNPPPFASGPPSSQWPSSPNRVSITEDQRIRDSFSHYSLQTASQPHSRPATPPPPPFVNGGGGGGGGGPDFGSWSWNSANRGDNKNLSVRDSSGPPTRRGSMAHILNPTDMAERDDEDDLDLRGDDDRKRKRLL
ncbi:HSF-type DNA-binding-domain-containing protein [Lasiosphaeria miniovina]|uniref:HSF-type DNA-binding-domain-containing protein n=1 Tax=Lasiosphaeria miniovina TaxID=1954250 RepID=A0AA40DMP1_9PEZI|nr:HSF-type DNA-binding-domain-containing protein [Lasiosphaeria miniovina]KAK0706477.1 HSF-type DNA-binding-domain-containing protein [Lasiosphaeria miniovina]